MKKITVLLTALACVFSFANVSMAQEQEASSDVVVNNDAALKKRPAPIPRAHIVEDYLPILGKQARANGIRPVVVLKDTVTTTGKNSNGAWILMLDGNVSKDLNNELNAKNPYVEKINQYIDIIKKVIEGFEENIENAE